jgi:5-methylcytosine-specific restriction endonuclease McrA
MSAVLLLNASYEPLSIITHQRAVTLLQRGRADAATEDAVTLRTVSTSWRVPTVLRLRHYVNVPRRGARWSRQAVFRRDHYRCIYCGVRAGDLRGARPLVRQDFTVDHIIPRSRGGKNSWGNTACACYTCNHRKGNRMPHESGMSLLWEPKIPRVDYLVASGEMPEAWKLYLELS